MRKFKEEWPDADLKPDHKVMGLQSRTLRQIDIFVTGSIVGKEMIGAIECKFFNKKVDVKHIDAFIGCLEDIGADFGIFITNIGFTKAAVERAKSKRIKVDVVKFAALGSYHLRWDDCEVCSYWRHMPYPIFWQTGTRWETKHLKTKMSIEIGNCSFCNTTHIRCGKCGTVHCIWEDYGEEKECYCGRTYVVNYENVGSGMMEECFYVKIKSSEIRLHPVHVVPDKSST